MKHIFITLTLIVAVFAATGCADDAAVVSQNLSKAADNFEIVRRIVFYNGITGEYMLVIEGACSIKHDPAQKQLEVTVMTGEGEFKKHFLGLSDNVTYFAEQIDGAKVSKYHYRVTFKPREIIPAIDVR
jgi:hypothetical protein